MSVLFCLRRFVLLLLLLCACLAHKALASDLPRPGGAGDGGHLWLVAPAPDVKDGWQVLHHQPGQAGIALPLPGGIRTPQALPDGSPAICAKGGTLYVAGVNNAEGQPVELEALEVSEQTSTQLRLTRRTLGQLPPKVKVLAMAADGQKLWLVVSAAPAELFQIVRVADGAKSGKVKEQSSTPLDLVLGLPPGTLAMAAKKEKEEVVQEVAGRKLSNEKKLFLLSYDGTVMQPHASFAFSTWAALASDGKQMLFAPSAQTLLLGMPKALQPVKNAGLFTHALFVGNQPVLAQVAVKHEMQNAAWVDSVQVDWSVLRNVRTQAGACALPLGDGEGYALVMWQGHATLARVSATFKPGQLVATLVPVDLQGGTLPPVELRQISDPQAGQSGILWLQSGVVLLALALMAWTWRNSPRLLPKLPTQYRRAGLLPRGFAAMMDLALVAVPVAKFFGVEVADILRHWPGIGEPVSLTQMVPGFVIGGLFILHTMLAEMFFGRSLGKVFMGLRVVDLTGTRPSLWRVFLRGILKWLELISPMLLIIAIFSPFGQRLGDLVSGTVVVAKARDPRAPGDSV